MSMYTPLSAKVASELQVTSDIDRERWIGLLTMTSDNDINSGSEAIVNM